jgi:hypothetical protein
MQRSPEPAAWIVTLAGALWACGAAQAQPSVFRCVDGAGKTTYQSQACDEGGRQSEVKLPAYTPAPAGPEAKKSAWTGYKAPRIAAITFYYDAKDEPVGFSTTQMEGMIKSAAAAWMAGCQVELRYGGKAPRRPGSPEHVSIHWVAEYMYQAHPSDARSLMAATGSMRSGIGMRPRFAEGNMLGVLVHEMGHVLGLPHNHEDPQSIMSYLQDEAARKKAQPSAADFLACNLSMKKMFEIEFAPPADASLPQRRRMSDREALEKIHGPAKR